MKTETLYAIKLVLIGYLTTLNVGLTILNEKLIKEDYTGVHLMYYIR